MSARRTFTLLLDRQQDFSQIAPIGLRCDQASGLFFVKNSNSGGPVLATLGVQLWPQIWDSGGPVLAPNFGTQMDSLGVQKWRRIWDQKWPLLFEFKKGGPEMATDFEQKMATDFGPKTHPQIQKWGRILTPRRGLFLDPKMDFWTPKFDTDRGSPFQGIRMTSFELKLGIVSGTR